MGNMNTGHDPVIAADPRYTAALHGTTAEGVQLTYGVVVTDDELGVFTGIFLVLWLFTDRCKLKDVIVLANGRATGQHCMRTDPGTRVYSNLGIYD